MIVKENLSSDFKFYKKSLGKLKEFNNKDLSENDLIEIFSLIGINQYIDSYVIELIIENKAKLLSSRLKDLIKNSIELKDQSSNKIYTYLDLLVELNYNVLSTELLQQLFEKHKLDNDIISLLLDYWQKFNCKLDSEFLYAIIENDYPDTIKLQALRLSHYLYNLDNLAIKDLSYL